MDARVIATTVEQARAIKQAGGESMEQAIARIRLEAIALREVDDAPIAVFTECGNKHTMIGVAKPGAAAVLQVDVSEYDGAALAKLLGFDLDPQRIDTRPQITDKVEGA